MQRTTLSRQVRKGLHHLLATPYWVGHHVHNGWGILNVFDIAWLRPMPGGLLPDTHPFVTGIYPVTGNPIWKENLIYRSPRKREFSETDEQIVEKVMSFLKFMVHSSASSPKSPVGKPTRMPPAVNYIHGCVHYNGVSLVFDDFPDAVAHFTDPVFMREFKAMLAAERREPTLIFRDRDYDTDEFAVFSCFMKSIFPYFGNPNGNKGRIHWGTPSPYPAFNLITGNWIRDTRMLLTELGRSRVARPPVARKDYFRGGPYTGGWAGFMLPEKLLSSYTGWRIGMRGEKKGIYFTDNRKLARGFRYDPVKLPTLQDRLKEKAAEAFRDAAGRLSFLGAGRTGKAGRRVNLSMARDETTRTPEREHEAS